MSVTGVSSTSSSSTTTSSSSSNSTLDRDAFLKLLVTELQNQDPLNPTDEKDSITQLAQFSSLEEMEKLNDSFTESTKNSQATQAFSMVGKWADYATSTGGTAIGRIDSVTLDDGVPSFSIDGESVAFEDVTSVYSGLDSFGQDDACTLALQMLGRQVQYTDPSTGDSVVGKPDSVSLTGGWPTLNINGSSVGLGDITDTFEASSTTSSGGTKAVAAAMVGKRIDYTDGGTTYSGRVTSYTSTDNSVTLSVNGTDVDISSVVKVYKN
jgi:flagellar basal-body rod modification protein FlgD